MKLMTALATPFWEGKIDLNSYTKLLVNQQNADSLLCCGTTGEGALLSECEKKLLVHTAKALLPNKQLWVGVNSGATQSAVREASLAEQWGADGILITPPSFFKCTEKGFVRHVTEISRAVKIPVMLYNAPSRCGYTLWENAISQLAVLGVHFIKDAGSDLDYASKIANKMQLFCGNEQLLQQFVRRGACGVVSVVSNIAPRLVQNVLEIFARENKIDCAKTGTSTEICKCKFDDNLQCQNKLKSLTLTDGKQCVQCAQSTCQTVQLFNKLADLCFCQINPVAVKYILHKQGIFNSSEMRLPLTEADASARQTIDDFWQKEICDDTVL